MCTFVVEVNNEYRGLHSMKKINQLTVSLLWFSLFACGGSSSDSPTTVDLSSNASLSDLSISVSSLDQDFQSSLFSFTASVGFLATTITVTATSTNANASISIQDIVVLSGESSQPIDLIEGSNTISIVVSAEDSATTQIYSVYVTRASAPSFAQQAYLKASNANTSNSFGFSVALDGDTLVVGASGAMAAYVFTRSAGIWTQQAYLQASNAEASDQFGGSVALSGNTVLVGAAAESSSALGGEADNSAWNAGAAYVFWQWVGPAGQA